MMDELLVEEASRRRREKIRPPRHTKSEGCLGLTSHSARACASEIGTEFGRKRLTIAAVGRQSNCTPLAQSWVRPQLEVKTPIAFTRKPGFFLWPRHARPRVQCAIGPSYGWCQPALRAGSHYLVSK
jgi:hypothetical protein